MHSSAVHWILKFPAVRFPYWRKTAGVFVVAASWTSIVLRVRQALRPQLAASIYTAALVLTLGAVAAGAVGGWRFGVDLGWFNDFPIADGWMSRYQIWLAVAIGAQAGAYWMNRWRGGSHCTERQAYINSVVFSAPRARGRTVSHTLGVTEAQ
jgi:hypothetical protein